MMIKTDNLLLNAVVILSISFFLSGCSNNYKNNFNSKLRVQPPIHSILTSNDLVEMDKNSITKHKNAHINNVGSKKPIPNKKNKKDEKQKECNIIDRFDRKMLFTFEQDNGNTKFSLDIDGLSYKSMEANKIFFVYKKKLNPFKSKSSEKKSRCRFKSKFQGLLGSIYNEIFLRKSDTVWSNIKNIKNEIKQSFY